MSKIVDCIIGHAIGDAMGVPTEFCDRNELLKHPIIQMIGYGSHDVPAGTWSDDTSMEIAIMELIFFHLILQQFFNLIFNIHKVYTLLFISIY